MFTPRVHRSRRYAERGCSPTLRSGLLALLVISPALLWVGESTAVADPDAGVADGADSDAGTSDAGMSDAGMSDAADTGLPSEPPGSSASQAVLVPPRVVASAVVVWPAGETAPADGVRVEMTVQRDGLATDVELLTEAISEGARTAVRNAVAELRFQPATRDGIAIPARIRYRFGVVGDAASGPAVGPSGDANPPPADGPRAGEASPSPEVAQPTPTSSGVTDLDAEIDAPVFGARARVDSEPPGAASQVQLRGDELTVVPGTFGEPLRVVGALPGVARTPFGLGFFAVRGASLQNTGFLVDGFPVPLLYHLGAGPAIISSRLVEGLDFYPGGYPASFGRYTAGVISVKTAPPPADRLHLEFEIDLLKASGLVVLPFDEGRGSIALAVRRSYYELVLPLVTDAVSLSYFDYQLRADYRFSDTLSASLFVFGSRDSLQFSDEIGQAQTTGQAAGGLSYSFDRVIASLRWQLSDALRLRWSGTAGPSAIDFGAERTGDDSLGVDTASFRLGQRIEAVLNPAPWTQTTLGFEQNAWINDLTGRAPSLLEFPLIEAPENTRAAIDVADRLVELTVAPYIEQVFRPGPLEITLGLRAERYRYGDHRSWQPEPRAVVKLAITDSLKIKGASGYFSQAPLPFQYNRTFGNPDLNPNRSLQYSAGVELKLPFSIEFDSSLFYSDMSQLTRGSGRLVASKSGTLPRVLLFEDDGEGRAYGWEVLLRRKVDEGLFGWVSYTLSRSERFLGDGDPIPFFFDQTHVLNLAASYKLGRWRFGARFSLATGRPTIDRLDRSDGAEVTRDADKDDFDSSSTRRARLPTFQQLDIRIDRDFTWGILEGSVYLDIINVYFANNAEGYSFEYDFGRRARVPGLPFLPTFGLRGVIE